MQFSCLSIKPIINVSSGKFTASDYHVLYLNTLLQKEGTEINLHEQRRPMMENLKSLLNCAEKRKCLQASGWIKRME